MSRSELTLAAEVETRLLVLYFTPIAFFFVSRLGFCLIGVYSTGDSV